MCSSITVSRHFMIAHSWYVFGPAQQLHSTTFIVKTELRRIAAARARCRMGSFEMPGALLTC